MMNSFKRALLATAAVAPFVILPIGTAAYAQAAARSYSIPAQRLGTALQQLATQSGRDVVFDPTLTAGKKSKAVHGTGDAEQALRMMLAGSGLAYTTTSQGFAVRSAVGNAPAAAETAASKGEEGTERGTQNDGPDSKAILVTGTRLSGPNASVPLKVYTIQRIEESGTTTPAAFLNTLPEVSVQSNPGRFSSTGGQTSVRIHGFPAGTTATLLNGRRLVPSADTSSDFDLSTLPLAFIERVDVLPSGSSAIYGSDAIAGVVNFITKRNVSGLHLSARVGHAANYTEQNYSAVWGKTWQRGSVSIVASYDTNTPLFSRDREIVANADYSRFAAQGGADQRVATCDPGNVSTLTGTDLPGLSSAVAAIPPGVTGRLAVNDLTSTEGTQNLCSNFKDIALIPAVKRAGILAEGHYEMGKELEVFGELLYVRSRSSLQSPLLSFTGIVPASNAFNPFGVSVIVRNELAIPSVTVSKKDFFRPVVGLRGKLFSDWRWELGAWRSQDHSPLLLLAQRQTIPFLAALASSDPTTALNPFSTGNPGPASVLSSVFPTLTNHFDFDVNALDATLRGKLFTLPAGPVLIALGGEYQWQHYINVDPLTPTSNSTTDVTRRVGALYSELQIPIFGHGGNGADLLDLTGAARYDNYNDFGAKATPQVGIVFRPADGFMLRGSYAQAFKAPQLTELYANQFEFVGAPIPDNGLPGSPIVSNVLQIFGGNRHLKPETGNAYSIGAVWSARVPSGLRASLDYWWLSEDNRIASPSVAAVLGNPSLFPGRAVRDANGVLLSVDTSFANFGGLRAEGFDLDLSSSLKTSFGEFEPSLNWVMTTKFKAAVDPGSPLVNRLGQATVADAWAVKNKATLGLGWSEGPYSLHAAARYIGRYRDYETDPANTNRLGNFALFDLSGRIELSGLMHQKLFQDATLTGSVTNIFNKAPQYSNFDFGRVGYDPAQADILGRIVRLGLTWNQ